MNNSSTISVPTKLSQMRPSTCIYFTMSKLTWRAQ